MEHPGRERPIADFRSELHAWLDAHHAELAPSAPLRTLDEQMAQMQRVKSMLFDAGWMRYGWPERVGGLGGSPMLRTELGAALAARDLADPGLFSLIEVLAPTLIDFAPPALAAEVVPRLLSGAEMWCQGFSEPGTGSDLAALRCRAVPDGDAATASTWVIDGQKVWTSLAQYADRCVLLTRTGPAEARHRGITAFFVDMNTPGITVAPLEMINGVREFAEVFFDGVVVPADRILGEVNGGWAVAMSILPYERSSCFWQRIAYLYRRLEQLVEVAPDDERSAEVVGDAFLHLHALRARSRATQHRLADGRDPRGGDVDRQGARRDGGARDVRRRAPPPARRRRDGRWRGSRDVAQRVPVLESRDDLRRDGRGAAQHHRPAPPRPRRRRMMDGAERALLEETVGAALAGAGPDADADAVLADLGWLEMLEAAPRDAIEIVFDALGTTNASTTALDDVVVSALGVPPRNDLAVLLPPFGAWDPPGRIDGGQAHAVGLATARAATAREMLVVLDAGPAARAVIIPTSSTEVARGAGHRSRRRLPRRADRAPRVGQQAGRRRPRGTRRSRRAGARSRSRSRARAGQCLPWLARTRWSGSSSIGRSRRSRPFATGSRTRSWLSRPSTRRLGAAADEPNGLTAALAKATAGRTAKTVATHCQQVLAGIGFTTDHPFHRFLKRTMVLEGLFGSSDEITVAVGRQLLAARRVPTLIEL